MQYSQKKTISASKSEITSLIKKGNNMSFCRSFLCLPEFEEYDFLSE